jgi:hypothetical protein
MHAGKLEKPPPKEMPREEGFAYLQRPTRRRLLWAEIVSSAILTSVIAVPTLTVEENWHGRPMIDQANHLWILAAVLVAAAFLLCGTLAGYRHPADAPFNAVASAGLAVAVLVACDVFRRLEITHNGLPAAVVQLWCLGAAGALGLGALGAFVGRFWASSRSPRRGAISRRAGRSEQGRI